MEMLTPAPEDPYVEIDRGDDAYEFRMHNVQAIANAIGERVLAAFYKCFVGVERIAAYEHLIHLNNYCARRPDDHPETDQHGFDRNLRVLVTLMHGIMYEMGEGLQNLCNAQVVTRIQNRELWMPLNKIRGDWHTEEYAALVRNTFAHHLGEVEDYVRGIRHADAPAVAVLHVFNRHRATGQYREPHDALLRAHNIQDQRHAEFVRAAFRDHVRLPELLQPLFEEVLRTCGVAVCVTERARVARALEPD
jgi:hypothetical protein